MRLLDRAELDKLAAAKQHRDDSAFLIAEAVADGRPVSPGTLADYIAKRAELDLLRERLGIH